MYTAHHHLPKLPTSRRPDDCQHGLHMSVAMLPSLCADYCVSLLLGCCACLAKNRHMSPRQARLYDIVKCVPYCSVCAVSGALVVLQQRVVQHMAMRR